MTRIEALHDVWGVDYTHSAAGEDVLFFSKGAQCELSWLCNDCALYCWHQMSDWHLFQQDGGHFIEVLPNE